MVRLKLSCGNISIYIAVVLFGATVFSYMVLSAAKTLAVVDDVTIIVPESCTLQGVVGVGQEHTKNMDPGDYDTNIGTTTLKAYCNDNNGFAIYAIGYTGDVYGATNLVGTNNSNNIIATGTATGAGGSSDPSNWAMKLSAISNTYTPIIAGSSADLDAQSGDTDYSNYAAVPSTWQKVAYRKAGTDTYDATLSPNAIGSRLTTTYAAYVRQDQAPDTYEGQVLYTLVHPHDADAPTMPVDCSAGKICYNPNGTSVVGTMGKQSAGNNASVTLLASNFSKVGYGFAGWSDAHDYATNENAHFYGPQEEITTPADTSTKGLSLYAVWVKSEGSLQDSAKVSSVCSRLTQSGPNVTKTLNSVSALTDQRDNQTYAIAKLADGNCWMIENLRLEAENTRGATNIALSQGYNTTNFTGLADAESTNFSNSTATNFKNTNTPYYGADGSGAEIIISASDHTYGSKDYSGYHFPRYNNTNTQSRVVNPTINSNDMYSYGNYYTWAAAMADTTFYRTTTVDADGYTPSEASKHSLCPTGWHLPYGRNAANSKGTTSGGFSYLDVQLGGTGANSSSSTTPTGAEMSKVYRTYPNNFLYSGYFNTSSLYSRGSNGVYWSSTASSYYGSYRLDLGSTDVYPGTDDIYKFYGRSIRCTAGSGA